jgi:hypothetical protein
LTLCFLNNKPVKKGFDYVLLSESLLWALFEGMKLCHIMQGYIICKVEGELLGTLLCYEESRCMAFLLNSARKRNESHKPQSQYIETEQRLVNTLYSVRCGRGETCVWRVLRDHQLSPSLTSR